jgi:hypothetical protein
MRERVLGAASVGTWLGNEGIGGNNPAFPELSNIFP